MKILTLVVLFISLGFGNGFINSNNLFRLNSKYSKKICNNICQRSFKPLSALKDDLKDFASIKSKLIKNFLPLIGFYALMLAPIYGIGLPGFLGSMTDFQTVQNRGTATTIPNEYFIAPDNYMRRARAQLESEVYPVSADVLQDSLDKVITSLDRISYIDSDSSTRRKEYVQRALIFRWPDVITYTTIPITPTTSTLALHSYSVYGAGDLGVNRARVENIISKLDAITPPR